MFRNVEQSPKTTSAVRQVDVACKLNEFLIQYIAGRTGGFLFPSRNGKALHDSSARAQLEKLGIPGWHGFRRWRVTQIRKISTPIDLENFWIGHSDSSMGAHYSKLREDLVLRRQFVEQIELGFELPEIRTVCHPEPHIASPHHPPNPVTTHTPASLPAETPYIGQSEDLDQFFYEEVR
jgi:hypothetical protein